MQTTTPGYIIEVYVQGASYDRESFAVHFATEREADDYQRLMLQDGHSTVKTRTTQNTGPCDDEEAN